MGIHRTTRLTRAGALAGLFVGAVALTGAQPTTLPTLKVRTMPYLTFSVFHLAETEGLFAKEGLRIQPIDMDASAPVIPALARGDLDVLPAVMSPALFNAIARGAEIRIVAAASELMKGGCTTTGIVANRGVAESGRLLRAEGWNGIRIVGNRAPFSAFLLERLLKPMGVSPQQLTQIDVPDAVEGDTIRSGRADIGFMSEPWLSRALTNNEGVLWKPLQEVAPGFQYTVLLYGPTLLRARPELGQRFMAAYVGAVRLLSAGKTARNIDAVASATGLDRDLLARACWPGVRADAQVNVAAVLEFQSWARDRKLIDRSLPPTEVFDPSFLDLARKVARPQH